MTRTERNLHMGSPTKDAPTGTLTYSEAYALAQKGAKITHRFIVKMCHRAHSFNSLHLIPTAKKPLMNIGLFVKLLMVV